MSPEPHPSYGEIELKINARDERAALRLAVDAAGNYVFDQRRPILDAEADELVELSLGGDFGSEPPSGDPRRDTWLEGGGAWTARVGRLSYPDANGRETDASYGVAALTLLGPRPHAAPHATDDAAYWTGAARAMDERAVLAQSSAPEAAQGSDPGRKPRL